MNEIIEEGMAAIDRKESPLTEEPVTASAEKVDWKKMIIYSELLKPKFDEGLE